MTASTTARSANPWVARRIVPRLLYQPGELSPLRSSPRVHGFPDGQGVWIPTEDRETLHAWWLPARSPVERTILFFHGNAGNVSRWGQTVGRWLNRLDFNVLVPDYRGYGRSSGSPSEEGLYQDGISCYRYLTEKRDVPAEQLILAGHSLGGAVAVHVGARHPCTGIMLTGAFSNTSAVARNLFPWIPETLLERWMTQEFPTQRVARKIDVPALVGHGTQDQVVPLEEGHKVYKAFAGRSLWHEAPGAGHAGVLANQGFRKSALSFLRQVAPTRHLPRTR